MSRLFMTKAKAENKKQKACTVHGTHFRGTNTGER